MNCEELDEKLLERAQGRLGVRDRIATESHLRRCASCRQRTENFRFVSSAFSRAASSAGATPLASIPLFARILGAPAGAATPLLAVMAAIVALTVVLGTVYAFEHRVAVSHPVSRPVTCSPDLPNDHCH